MPAMSEGLEERVFVDLRHFKKGSEEKFLVGQLVLLVCTGICSKEGTTISSFFDHVVASKG